MSNAPTKLVLRWPNGIAFDLDYGRLLSAGWDGITMPDQSNLAPISVVDLSNSLLCPNPDLLEYTPGTSFDAGLELARRMKLKHSWWSKDVTADNFVAFHASRSLAVKVLKREVIRVLMYSLAATTDEIVFVLNRHPDLNGRVNKENAQAVIDQLLETGQAFWTTMWTSAGGYAFDFSTLPAFPK